MKLGFSQQEIISTAKSLGLPTDGFVQRRVARAFDLVETNKVSQIDDGIFRVRSQWDEGKSYIVNVNSGDPSCDCPDGERTINCKHRIASLLYARKQAQAITVIKTTDGNLSASAQAGAGDYWRRCWCIAQGNRRTLVYEEPDGRLFCNCGAYYNDCKHKQLVIKAVTNELKAIAKEKPVVNECGSEHAKQLQDKMNGQLDSQNNNGNGAYCAPSQPMKLDLLSPFQESESYDIEQVEGKRNGELAWKLSNGTYCISYKGIMKLAEKHEIRFTTGENSNTKQVIARARLNGNERVSGKLPIPSYEVAVELAKRNAARQLLPLEEIKAIEYKAKLNAEFSWKKAYAKCVELVGTEANVDIIIFELVRDNKLRQDTPSHYDRTEWLIIHNACKQDASNDNNDGGDNTPSSNEVNRYKVLADAPVNENWRERHRECTKLVGFPETDLIISQELNFRYRYYKNKITDEQWDIVQKECQWRWNAKQAKAEFASAQQAYKFKHIRDISGKFDTATPADGYDVKSKQFVGRPPLNSKEFIAKCQQAIDEVREEDVGLSPTITTKSIEANEMPLMNSEQACLKTQMTIGKRKLQMDKKLRTWLVEADGTKKEISCREICETFESKQNPSIVTRLRAGIDDGADIGIVELDD